LTRATSSTSVPVALPRSLAPTLNLVMRRVLVPLLMALTVLLLPDRVSNLYRESWNLITCFNELISHVLNHHLVPGFHVFLS
jgi:hypothetical protein